MANTNRTFSTLKQLPKDLYLEEGEDEGFVKVFIPTETTNLVLNPTMHDADGDGLPDGYTTGIAIGVVPVAIEDSPFWRNAYRLNMNTGLEYFFGFSVIDFFAHIESGVYTTSIWVRSEDANAKFRIKTFSIGDSNTQYIEHSEEFTATTEWEQYSYAHDYGEPVDIRRAGINIAPGNPDLKDYDLAGVQVEERTTATSMAFGFAGNGYDWLGEPFGSPSTRSEDVICGGLLVDLRQLGMRLIEIVGLGIPEDFSHNTTQRAFEIGSIFNCLTIESREIEMKFLLHTCSYKDLMCSRNKIGRAIFSLNQPRCFLWQVTECGVPCGPAVKFTGVLDSGYAQEFTSGYGEEIDLTFINYDIEIVTCETTCVDLTISQDLTHQAIVGIDDKGFPVEFPPIPATPGSTVFQINDAVVSPYNNKLYVGGSQISPLTIVTGVILCYDGVEWQLIGTSADSITTIHAAGKYVLAGSDGNNTMTGLNGFTGTSGNGIGIFDLTDETVLTGPNINATPVLDHLGGTLLTPTVSAFATDNNGNVYIGGNFDGFNGFTSPDLFSFSTINESSNIVTHANRGSIRGGILTLFFQSEYNQLWMGGDFQENNIAFPIAARTLFGWSFAINDEISGRFSGQYDYVVSGLIPGTITSMAWYNDRLVVGGSWDASWVYSQEEGIVFGIQTMESLGWVGGDRVVPFTTEIGAQELFPPDIAINDLTVCNGKLLVAGHFNGYGHLEGPGNFIRDGNACGNFEIISSGSAEHGVIIPSAIEMGFTGGSPDATCNVTRIVCGSDRIGMETVFLNGSVLNAGGTNVTSVVPLPTEVDICSTYLPVSPTVFLSGPGKIEEVSNITNNTRVFIDYEMVTGELITIDMNSRPISVDSSLNGDISSSVQAASRAIVLEPEEENSIIIKLNYDTDSDDTTAWMCYTSSSLSAESLICDCPDV